MCWLIVIGLFVAVGNSSSLNCSSSSCVGQPFWGPVTACLTGSMTVKNAYCANGQTLLQCLAQSRDLGVLYAGSCACPSNCLPGGTCQNNGCSCRQGFAGPSCSLCVSCSCNATQCLDDCSGVVLPPVQWPQIQSGGIRASPHPLFNMSRVTTIYTTIKHLDWLVAPSNVTSKDGVGCDSQIKFPQVSSIGGNIRIKGSSSRFFSSKSFHLDLGSSSSVDGISKIALKSGEMDNSLIRELKTCELLYALGAPVYRASYYQLFVNQILFGVYVGLEEIDGSFLKDRFGTKKGVFIKPQLHSKLEYLGPYSENKARYDAIYKSKSADGVEQLVDNLLLMLNTSDAAAVGKIFDWDMFLRTYAVEVMTGNWDGLWNGNNWYLYKNESSAKWVYFREDFDLSFGVGGLGHTDFSTRNVWRWAPDNPLTRLFEADAAMSARYRGYLELLIAHMSAPAYLSSFAALQQQVRPALLVPWRIMDFPWTLDTFDGALSQDFGFGPQGFVQGVLPFLQDRTESAALQLKNHPDRQTTSLN